jgi:putative hydrolase of the HAD superfamily
VIKAVIFDLYETLITAFDPCWEPPKRSLADRLGIPEEGFQKRFERLIDEWETGRIGDFGELLNKVCEESGRDVPTSVTADLVRERSAEFSRPFKKIDPAIVEMIQKITSRGFRVGVVTNVANMDLEGWPDSELAPLIDNVVPSFEVGVMKPDALIYRRGLEMLQVEADETVYVGDGGNDELSGADRVGMTACWATWFLDRWPHGIRPGERFDGDEWRQFPGHEPPFLRIDAPGRFVDWLLDDAQIPHPPDRR